MDGYEFKTTFWDDFTIADMFGADAVRDTFRRAFGEWRDDVEYVTELALVLNWRCWKHYERGDSELAELYGDLYHEVDDWCWSNIKGGDIDYYFRMTD